MPKFHFDWETGELGERNGVTVTNVEHKMGLKVSTTCELTFGEREPAVGWLVGEVHDGIAQMFKVIEYARMMVGTKAIATLSTGYLNALDYAKTRVQGADLTQMTDKAAPRVTITHHPDVRRSLMLQKAYAEGMRALVLYTATIQDQIAAGEAAGAGRGDEHDLAVRLNDLLLPIVKGFGSEKSYELLGAAVAADLRRLGLPAGLPARAVHPRRQDRHPLRGHDRDPGHGLVLPQDRARQGPGADQAAHRDPGVRQGRRGQRRAARRARPARQGARGRAGHRRHDGRLAHRVGRGRHQRLQGRSNTTRLLLACGDLVTGWLLLRQADVALAALDAGATGRDRAFYEGKVAAATFFARQTLPLLAAQRAVAEGVDNEIMELPEDAF